MIKFKFNKSKLIPNIIGYLKILASSFVVVYGLKKLLVNTFPVLETLPDFWALVFWVLLITYLKDLIDIKINGRDYL